MLTELLRQAVQAIGIQGVSAGVLALLVAVALYSHKAATAGQRVVHAGSTISHDVRIVALVLALLLGVGIIEGVDVQRVHELGQQFAEFDWGYWTARLRGWLA